MRVRYLRGYLRLGQRKKGPDRWEFLWWDTESTAHTSSRDATPSAANRQVPSSMRVQAAKRGGRTSNLTVEHCCKVGGTAKACFRSDLVNTQRRLLEEKVLRKRNSPS